MSSAVSSASFSGLFILAVASFSTSPLHDSSRYQQTAAQSGSIMLARQIFTVYEIVDTLQQAGRGAGVVDTATLQANLPPQMRIDGRFRAEILADGRVVVTAMPSEIFVPSRVAYLAREKFGSPFLGYVQGGMIYYQGLPPAPVPLMANPPVNGMMIMVL